MTQGYFNYVIDSTPSSLYRTGKHRTRRNETTGEVLLEGIVFAEHEMAVQDARQLTGGQRPTVGRNGFELLHRPLLDADLDFLDDQVVCSSYYAECAHALRDATGAAHVIPFDHNVRSAEGYATREQSKGGQRVGRPEHITHGDYTLVSAPQRLRMLAEAPSLTDTMRDFLEPGEGLLEPALVERGLAADGRFAIINVWRNIAHEPVSIHPLALCDAQTVRPEDLIVFELHYADRIGENYFSKHASRHQWYYYPNMTRDEALLIKQWDSAGTLARSEGARADADDRKAPCTFNFHSAFTDPTTPKDAPDRRSIEVRCLLVY
ncbi:MAG: hypothetical protein CMO26_22965 [Thiotrichales bacterium]|nr:hypothetical protein [Thiotrichales bacterium]